MSRTGHGFFQLIFHPTPAWPSIRMPEHQCHFTFFPRAPRLLFMLAAISVSHAFGHRDLALFGGFPKDWRAQILATQGTTNRPSKKDSVELCKQLHFVNIITLLGGIPTKRGLKRVLTCQPSFLPALVLTHILAYKMTY